MKKVYFLVESGWGQWGEWGSCTKTCNSRGDSAKRMRYRPCDNPHEKYGGVACGNCCDFETSDCETGSWCDTVKTNEKDSNEEYACPYSDEAITYVWSTYDGGARDRIRRVKCGTVYAPGRRQMDTQYWTGWLHDLRQDRDWWDVSISYSVPYSYGLEIFVNIHYKELMIYSCVCFGKI